MTDVVSEFDRRMDALGPFEAAPRIAVALSGGADSLALVFLADAWARTRHGSVLALHLDHGLRPGSEDDAHWLGRRMAAAHIAYQSMRWRGDKPKTGIQSAAREARYRLLGDACREAGLLHLLLGHHKDDQAETVEMRRRRQSGPDGLAGMSAVLETPDLRLLRPLLGIERGALRAYLEARDEPWLEDPANEDMRFTRTRLRRDLSPSKRQTLVAQARQHGQQRIGRENEDAAHIARSCAVRPEGHAFLDVAAWRASDKETRQRCLGRLLRTVGGMRYVPPTAKLSRLEARIGCDQLGRGATLCGCRVIPHMEGLLFCREHRRPDAHRQDAQGGRLYWDNRFVIDLAGDGDAWLAPLGRRGWRQVKAMRTAENDETPIPGAVAVTLPALWDKRGLRQAPHLGFLRARGRHGREVGHGFDDGGLRVVGLSFRPRYPLSGIGFCLA